MLTICRAGQAETRTVTNQWSVLLRSVSDVCDSSPAIGVDGTIYFGTFLGDLHALKSDGARKWTFEAGREIKASPAVGPDGTIYFGCRNRKLFAVSANGWEKSHTS